MDGKVLLIALMAVANAALKMLPVRLLGGRKLPAFFLTWLRYVPVPVIAAMLASELLVPHGKLELGTTNLPLLAAVPAFVVAYLSRSLSLTVVVGMGALALARMVWG